MRKELHHLTFISNIPTDLCYRWRMASDRVGQSLLLASDPSLNFGRGAQSRFAHCSRVGSHHVKLYAAI
jgi:hypothetical protein